MERLKAIAEAPRTQHANVLPLAGRGVVRVRQGDWRAIFRIEEADVILIHVARRREVYQ
jgi:mRNA interferase RelE/StbE